MEVLDSIGKVEMESNAVSPGQVIKEYYFVPGSNICSVKEENIVDVQSEHEKASEGCDFIPGSNICFVKEENIADVQSEHEEDSKGYNFVPDFTFCSVKEENVDVQSEHEGKESYEECIAETEPNQSKGTSCSSYKVANTEKLFCCFNCLYKTAHKSRLIVHTRYCIKSCTREKMLTFNRCTSKAKNISQRISDVNTGPSEKTYKCNQCPYRSYITGNMEKHMKKHTEKHTGEKSFNCNECTFRTAHKRSLKYHMMTHTGEKRFICNICSFGAVHKPRLVNHMKTHNGEKPPNCS